MISRRAFLYMLTTLPQRWIVYRWTGEAWVVYGVAFNVLRYREWRHFSHGSPMPRGNEEGEMATVPTRPWLSVDEGQRWFMKMYSDPTRVEA